MAQNTNNIDEIRKRTSEIQLVGPLRFSRGPVRECCSTLKYDYKTEQLSKTLVESAVGKDIVQRRFRELSGTQQDFVWPQHVPYRILGGTDLGGRENVFVVFPFALGTDANDISEVAGIELVEFTEQIVNRIILPSVRYAFGNAREVILELSRISAANAIYIYAVFHEAAHFLGEYSLGKHENRENPDRGAASELWADLFAFYMIKELRPVVLLQVLMRLFWYLPKGPKESDGDVLVSYCIIEMLLEVKALKLHKGKVLLELGQIDHCFDNLSQLQKDFDTWIVKKVFNPETIFFVNELLRSTEITPKELV